MKEPKWILEKVALSIYAQQMKEHGGQYGIRNIALLQSALAHPMNLWNYEKSQLHVLAAAYSHRICSNHPFVDGNKRVSFVTMRLFLCLNDRDICAPSKEKIDVFIEVAAGNFSEKQLANWIFEHYI